MFNRARSIPAACVLAALVVSLSACQADQDPSARRRTPRDVGAAAAQAPATTLTGTLRGGAVAIGGETTGWRLVGDGATGGFDLDVSKVQARARQLDGRRVTATGRMTTRDWPERGQTQVLVVESLEAGAEPGR